MLAWKIAPAIADGNLPSCEARANSRPLTALVFAHICQEVGLPAGVVNISPATGRTAKLGEESRTSTNDVTGSTEVGRRDSHAGAEHKKL